VDKLPGMSSGGRRHGEGSAAWLEARGWTELASCVRDHPVTLLADDAGAARLAAGPLGARVVAYADKRAGQRLEPMAARFASWHRRYPAGRSGWNADVAALVLARAGALERDVCAAAGVDPGDVRRLRWSRRALREAAG
jgi:hypothetical protein